MAVVSVVLTIATVTVSSFSSMEKSLREQHDILGSLAASRVQADLLASDHDGVQRLLRSLSEHSIVAGMVLFDADRSAVDALPEGFELSAETRTAVLQGGEVREGDAFYRAWSLRRPDGEFMGSLALVVTLGPMRSSARSSMWSTVLALAPLLLAILGLFAWQLIKGHRTLCLAMRMQETSEKAKDQFLSSISHELRTPLTNISSFAELLRLSDTGQSEESSEFLQIIDGECRRLSWVVDEVLTFTSLQTDDDLLRREVTDVPATMGAILRLQQLHALRRSVSIESHVAQGPHYLEVHKKALLTVTVRLLDNAIKFSPDGGRVILAARAETNRLVVAVHDQGIGIPAKDRETIFEPLHQLGDVMTEKPTGAGMGLAICRAILELVGGDIWYEQSGELGGAKMCFAVPAAPKEGSGTFAAVRATTGSRTGRA